MYNSHTFIVAVLYVIAMWLLVQFYIRVRALLDQHASVTSEDHFLEHLLPVRASPHRKLSNLSSAQRTHHVDILNDTDIASSDNIQCIDTQTHPGFRICVYDPNRDIYISGGLWASGVWEPIQTEVIQTALRTYPEAVLLDIGANIGYYTLLAATMGHRVVAVEPAMGNLQRLKKGLQINQQTARVVVVTNPMSDAHRNVTLSSNFDNQGGLSVRHRVPCVDDGVWLARTKTEGKEEVYRTSTIDHLLQLMEYPQVILKIDIGKVWWGL